MEASRYRWSYYFPIKRELLVYKKNLLTALENVDLKELMKHLVKDCVVSQELSKYFNNLDYDRLEQEVVAGFLVNELLRSIESKKMVQDFPDKLEKEFSGTEHLCAVVKSCITEITNICTTVGIGLVENPKGIASTYPGIGKKRSFPGISSDILTYKDIPWLTEVFCECSLKWEELGIALKLPEHELECRKASSNALMLHRVLSTRFRRDKSTFTLQTLKDALKSNLVGMKSLADLLEEKFKEHMKEKEFISKKPKLQLSLGNENNTMTSDNRASLLGHPRCDEAQSYQWKKEAESLQNDSNYYGVCDDVLLIKGVRQGMEVEYSCYTNDGRLVSKISLEVIFSPEKRKLLDKYTRLEEIPNTWPPVGASSFVDLALIHNDRHHVSDNYDYSVRGDMDDILGKKRKVNYRDVFSNTGNNLLILLEGRPGCGKTTLTHKITKDWARGPDILKGAQELFLVPLRILASKNIYSLSDILKIIYHNREMSRKIVNKLDNNDGERACFVIDGLDEYKERDNPDNLIYQLINKEYLTKAVIIVASCPVGTVNVRGRASKRVEVLGFSKDQIKVYMEAYSFKDKINSVSRLEAFLKDHVNVHHMCYLPVHAAMICYIYDHYGEIPSTETKIYELFTLLTIKRMLMVNNDLTKITSLRMLEGSLHKSFDNICRLAFDMTVSSKQAALENDIKSHLSDEVPNIHSLGLVTIDSTARLLDFEHLYSFLHLTFQEFCCCFSLDYT